MAVMAKKDTRTFGERFKELRESLPLTQAEAAKLLDVSARTLQNWEQGRNVPSKHLQKLFLEKLKTTK